MDKQEFHDSIRHIEFDKQQFGKVKSMYGIHMKKPKQPSSRAIFDFCGIEKVI